MILLTGVTGTVGQALLNEFESSGTSARVLVRSPDKRPTTAGIETVIGDFSPTALAKALDGIDTAFLLMGNCPEQAELETRFVDCAKTAGVKHLVKLSATGADSGSQARLKKSHGEVEDYLAKSGLTFTSLRPNFFMQNLLHVASTINSMNQFFMPMGDAQVGAIDARDVAKVALNVMTSEGHDNKTYELSGPSLVSFSDMATTLTQITGREIQYINISNADFRQQMAQFSPPWYADAVGELFERIANNESALVCDTVQELTGQAPRSLAQFIEDHQTAFTPSE